MSTDYVPDSFENIHSWTTNLDTEIAVQAPTLGWLPAQTTAFQDQVVIIRDAAAEVLQKQDDLDTAVGNLRSQMDAILPGLRLTIGNIKTTAGYTPGMGAALRIVTTGGSSFDPSTYKPQLKAQAFAGYVRLTGRKLGADAVNIYTRLQGQAAWRLLVGQRLRFPCDDDAPLAVPGTPEVREYRAIGVKADSEVGQPSDIVTATFAG